MSHPLAGDVQNFGNLEHVDSGAPKTTDLDQEIQNKACPEAHPTPSSRRPFEATRTTTIDEELEDPNEANEPNVEMEKEDVITVKYLPLNFSHPSVAPTGDHQTHNEDPSGVSFILMIIISGLSATLIE